MKGHNWGICLKCNKFHKMPRREKNSGCFKKGVIPFMKGKKHTPETLLKMRLIKLGKHHTEEWKQGQSKRSKKLWENPQYRDKMITNLKGHKVTDEQRTLYKNLYTGKPRTKETIERMSKALSGKNHPNYGKHLKNETKMKISKTLMNHKVDPETIIKIKNTWNDEKREKSREKRMKQIFPFKDSKPEKMMQIALQLKGINFEKHKPILGQPDIFIEPNICIFVDGCYWHGCTKCFPKKELLKSNIQNSIIRDVEINHKLNSDGYDVIRIWEHEILKDSSKVAENIITLIKTIQSRSVIR